MDPKYLDQMTDGYLAAALFTAPEEVIPPCPGEFDRGTHVPMCSAEMREEARKVCAAFYTANAADLSTYDADDAGMDLWYTINRHGVGFWEADHCTEEEGERLTRAAQRLPERNVYINDAGEYAVD